MGNTRVVAGLAGNVLRQANSITASSENALFPASRAGNGLPADPFVGGTPAANDHLTVDACQIKDPDFDSDTNGNPPPAPWVVTTGVTVSNAQSNSSPNSLRFNASSQQAHQDREFVKAADYDVSAALFGDGTNNILAKLLNLQTGRWLNTSAAWQDAETHFHQQSAASWSVVTRSFTVENIGYGVIKLRLLIDNPTSAAAAYADDLLLMPKIDFASLHGHNLVAKQAVEIRRSTDNFAASNVLVATITHNPVRVFDSFTAPAVTRYWRFLIPDNNVTPVVIHEAVFGHLKTLTRSADIGRSEPVVMPQADSTTRGQVFYRTNLSEFDLQNYVLRYSARTAGLAEMLGEIWRAARSGKDPVILVPDDARSEVIHGRMRSSVPVTREFIDRWQFELSFDEDGFSVGEVP